MTARVGPRRALALCAVALCGALAATCGGPGADAPAVDAAALVPRLAALPWDSVRARARGTTVVWRMWRGDPSVNAYVDRWVAPRLLAEHGVRLEAIEGHGPELVNQLVVAREARRAGRRAPGVASLVWINGETFANLRAERLLAGPWAGRLPNAAYVDSASPIVARDFEQDPAGYESPWGRVQFALIWDTVRTPRPPATVAELAGWIRAHPGRFTHDQGFTGVTFLKGVTYALHGGARSFQGGFDETRYAAARTRTFAWLDSLTPFFWRAGRTYPPDVAAMHRLFANGEIDASMSNNQHDVIAKARQGILPPTARAVLLRDASIANAHYVGIPFDAPNPAGAMIVADFLLSPAAQLEKQRPDVWADGTVLDLARLPAAWRARFAALAADPRAIPTDTLARWAQPEVGPRWHERLSADWRAMVRAR